MADSKLSQGDLMEKFAVMYTENHEGTFNGCLETLHLSLEDFIKEKIRELIPNVRLDHRTPLGRQLAFLRGLRETFIIVQTDGSELSERKTPPTGGIFTQEGSDFMDDLIHERNGHTHRGSNYPIIANLQKIKISIGSRVLVFNPVSQNPTLIIETDGAIVRDDASLMIIRRQLATDMIDMVECTIYDSDLILECLTKKEFLGDALEENLNVPAFGANTHALVIYYGTRKFFVYMKREGYALLHSYFGYDSGDRWKTHYFKFRAHSLLVPMEPNGRGRLRSQISLPQKPKSAFDFMLDDYVQMKAERSEGELMMRSCVGWSRLTVEEKRVYFDKEEDDVKRYLEELRAYYQQFCPNNPVAGAEAVMLDNDGFL